MLLLVPLDRRDCPFRALPLLDDMLLLASAWSDRLFLRFRLLSRVPSLPRGSVFGCRPSRVLGQSWFDCCRFVLRTLAAFAVLVGGRGLFAEPVGLLALDRDLVGPAPLLPFLRWRLSPLPRPNI